MSGVRAINPSGPKPAVVWPVGLVLFASLLFPQCGWAVSEAKNCTPEPTTNMPIAYGNVLSGADCVITPIADLDSFQFTAAANDTIRVLSVKTGGGTFALPCIELRDPDGLPVGSKVCGNNNPINQALSKPGTYKILVTEQTNDDVVNYNLSLTRMFPFQAGASPINYGRVLSDEVNPAADLDLVCFLGQHWRLDSNQRQQDGRWHLCSGVFRGVPTGFNAARPKAMRRFSPS